MRRFNLPDLGEGLQEAEIVRWHVAVGDTVAVDQPMVAMETAKAVVEVPAPWAGIITALHGRPGDTIATGAPLVDFQGESEADETGGAAAASDSTADAATLARGGVVGHMPETGEVMASQTLSGGRAVSSHRRSRVVPAARELARRLGIDVDALQGSGAAGLVTLDDVLAAQPATITPAPHLAHSTSALRPATTNGDIASTGELEVLRSLRRAMAQSMTLARDSVMECTVFDDADIEGWRQGSDYTVRLLRAITAGCRAEPGLNAWFDGGAQGRRVFQHIHVGIAVDTPEGLLVPVIRDAAARDAAALRGEVNRLKAGARDRSLPAADLKDFTIMLSNFGVMAGRYATPVVVPPAVAILGAGRISRDVVAVEDSVEVHRRIPLSLTFDHRCVTGGEAVRFLAAVIADLQQPD
ncbi:MAG TPA: dihydrolipoamide acetyltransferase family protein [Steroidobacteraceae bacterium]|nr:dihydrolipoamide acetyltransferase family protein [Steroidobacteraceae bacterium]